jgi:hypothetical protein
MIFLVSFFLYLIIIIKLHKRPVLFLGSCIFYNKIAPHGKNSRFPGFSGSTVQQAGAGAAAQTRIWRPNTSSKPPGRGKGVVPPTPRTLQSTAVVPSKKKPEIKQGGNRVFPIFFDLAGPIENVQCDGEAFWGTFLRPCNFPRHQCYGL